MAKSTPENPRRARPSTRAGFMLVLGSGVLSVVSYGALAETVRIRWTIGAYQHYGPEYASTLAVLAAFPLVTAGLYVGLWRLENYVERTGRIEDRDEFRTVYDVCALLTLGTILAVQLALIVLNL